MRYTVLVVALLVGCESSKTTTAAKKVYTRDEFREAVMGKTGPQVIAALGKPEQATDNEDGTPREWTYRDRVTNPTTGKVGTVFLRFEGGNVVHVDW